jgi:hypothetical protein
MPCECRTFSATRICSSRLAPAGEPEPPLAAQVLDVNCRPPEYPLPLLMPQFPPDSHCAMASQFTLYALIGAGGGASGAGPGGTLGSKPTGAGGGASGGGATGAGGGGGTFGSKPTGAGAGASGAGGGGASGAGPAGGTFGFMPIASALALADGSVASVPVIAARTSVFRTFFNIVPFAVRARQSKPTVVDGVLVGMRRGVLGRAVSFWHDSGGLIRPAANARRPRDGCCRPQPRSHAGP